MQLYFFQISGDRLQATDSDEKHWNTPQNAKITFNYPKSGVGAVITFIQLLVEQVSVLIGINCLFVSLNKRK